MKNLKKLIKEFNAHLDQDDFKSPKAVKLSIESFEPLHLVNAQRNQVSSVLQLTKKVIECSALHVEFSSRSSFMTLYVNSSVKDFHGFGRYNSILVKVKNKNSKKFRDTLVSKEWNKEDIKVDGFQSIFGYDLSLVYPEKYQSALDNSVIKIDETQENFKRRIAREFTEELYQQVIIDLHYNYGRKNLEELCELTGHELKVLFPYVERIVMTPSFINMSSKTIEIGFESRKTYNSLPVIVKIEKLSEIKTASLSDLGIEGAGYYSHDDRMSVLAEDASKAKDFKRRFNKAENKAYKALQTSIKKVG